ncbi:MAG: hypothetical protein ACE5FN_02690 [Leptospirillia bacterium]
MAMVRFIPFTPKDHEIVKAYEAAEAQDADNIPADLAEQYRVLVKDNFGKLMSTMIGEIARFFDIAIKRKYNWESFYGWIFSYHKATTCWYGISYKSKDFLNTCFAVKYDDHIKEVLDGLIADEGYEKVTFGRDNSDWVIKRFVVDVFDITDDEAQMTAFSKVAEDQIDLLEI